MPTVQNLPLLMASGRDPRVDLSVRLAGSECFGVNQLKAVGTPDPAQRLQITFQLKAPEDSNTLEPFRNVLGFVRDNGWRAAYIDDKARRVTVQATVEQFDKAFDIALKQYQIPGTSETVRAYSGQLSLPSSLATVVDGVDGLVNVPVRKPVPPQGVPSEGYRPAQIAAMYNFPKGLDGSGQTIGILAFGSGFQRSDLEAYWKQIGVQAPRVTYTSVAGQANDPSAPTSGELTQDIEIAGAIAPAAHIVVYNAPDSRDGWKQALRAALTDETNRPKILSVSWGDPEDGSPEQREINEILREAASRGVTLFVASGDSGSGDGVRDGKNHVDFPASSPYAVAVGGTTLTSDRQGHLVDEIGWFGSGGGVSAMFPQPMFQNGATPKEGRGVPDMAGVAATHTPYAIYFRGHKELGGGTSCAAPLMAGLAALLTQGVGHPLGYLSPLFYENPGAFRPVLEGNNGAFNASPGWNAVTGLGVPDGTRLLEALRARDARPN